MRRSVTCGHDAQHYAHGLCKSCYDAARTGEQTRSRPELLDILAARREAFVSLGAAERAAIDAERFLPTLELHRILDHYLWNERCADERSDGTYVKWRPEAAA